jgi:hypothetical protein
MRGAAVTSASPDSLQGSPHTSAVPPLDAPEPGSGGSGGDGGPWALGAAAQGGDGKLPPASKEGDGAGAASDPTVAQRVASVLESAADSVESAMGVADSVIAAALDANEFVADVASSLVQALVNLAERAPVVGQCAAVLKDIFALYKVGVVVCT